MSAAEPIMRAIYAEEPPASYNTAPPTEKPNDKISIYLIVKSAQAKGIPSGTKEVLAQICNMTEYGDHQCYDGNVETLAKKVGLSRPKVSLHLKRLVECGLLLVSDQGKRTKRSYRPCPELVSAYRLGNTLQVAEVIRSTYHSVTKVRTTVLPSTYHSVTNNSKEDKREVKEDSLPTVLLGDSERNLREQLAAALAANEKLLIENASLKDELLTERNTSQDVGRQLAEVIAKNQVWEGWGKRKLAQVERLQAENAKLAEQLKPKPATKKAEPAAKFVPPTFDEMLAYMLTQRPHNHRSDVERIAHKCFGYYTGNGWKVGKNPMKDWKGGCQTFLADLPKAEAPGNAVAETSHLAVPQHPDAFRHEVKPELQAQWEAEEQARRQRIINERIAKYQAEQANQTT